MCGGRPNIARMKKGRRPSGLTERPRPGAGDGKKKELDPGRKKREPSRELNASERNERGTTARASNENAGSRKRQNTSSGHGRRSSKRLRSAARKRRSAKGSAKKRPRPDAR
jgi:hypothetical protein